MRCLIVDDEALARQRLGKLLGEIGLHEVCGEAANGEQALALVNSLNPDTLLLDIRMPGMDGLEVARHLDQMANPPAIIFTTAYADHALQAFEAQAIDYLLKPIDRQRLQQALDKAQRLNQLQLETLNSSSVRTHLCASSRGNLQVIPIEDVIYLQAGHKYVTVCCSDRQILIEESLKALEEEFAGRFLRIHRNALIAQTALRGLEKNSDGHACVVLEGVDERLEVSRRLLPEIRRRLKQGRVLEPC